MATDERALVRYRFTPNLDLSETLTALGVEYLDVSATRVIVIYTRAIINIEIADGRLDNARILEIEVLDHPPKAGGDNPTELITMLVKRISTTADSDYQQIS